MKSSMFPNSLKKMLSIFQYTLSSYYFLLLDENDVEEDLHNLMNLI